MSPPWDGSLALEPVVFDNTLFGLLMVAGVMCIMVGIALVGLSRTRSVMGLVILCLGIACFVAAVVFLALYTPETCFIYAVGEDGFEHKLKSIRNVYNCQDVYLNGTHPIQEVLPAP